MLYADEACIVSRLPQGFAKIMEAIVEVCRAFALTVSAKKTETMCMPPPRTPRTMVRIEAAGQIYKQVQSFTYLGGAVTETPDMSGEIARRTRACWMRIRRYSRELYGQPKVALSLKTRMVKAEAIADCVQSDIRAFGITGDWETMAVKAEVWVEAVTKGGRRFMAAWRQEEEDAARRLVPAPSETCWFRGMSVGGSFRRV